MVIRPAMWRTGHCKGAISHLKPYTAFILSIDVPCQKGAPNLKVPSAYLKQPTGGKECCEKTSMGEQGEVASLGLTRTLLCARQPTSPFHYEVLSVYQMAIFAFDIVWQGPVPPRYPGTNCERRQDVCLLKHTFYAIRIDQIIPVNLIGTRGCGICNGLGTWHLHDWCGYGKHGQAPAISCLKSDNTHHRRTVLSPFGRSRSLVPALVHCS
jgi:hypothetical protein